MTGTTPASVSSPPASSPLRNGHDKSVLQAFMTDDDLAGADWNEMMNAVKIRLSLTVNEMFSQPEM